MAIISRGTKKSLVDEINVDGVATQKELNDALANHILDKHGVGDSIGLPDATESNQIVKSNDALEWVVVNADDPDEGLQVLALPYYWDDVRGKYLGNETERIMFFNNGTNKKNVYYYYTPSVVSSTIPCRIFGEHCLVALEWYNTTTVTGKVMELRNKATSNSSLYDLTVSSKTEAYLDTLNVTIPNGTQLEPYVGNITQANPTLILYLKKVYIV